MVELHIGIWPPELEEGDEEKKTSRVSSAWSREQFSICPQGADEEVVERHARVWLWHFVSDFLPTDAAGNTMSWMVLPLLGQNWDNIRGFGFGSESWWVNLAICALSLDPRGFLPTFTYVWKYAEPIHGPPARRYKFYTNELDCVTQTQVEWTPYNQEQLSNIIFSPMCYRDRELWRIDRKKRYKENDRRVKHAAYLQLWDNMQRCDPMDGPH
ncbi:protein MAIN-LIKE 2-like [Setaria viridis]|uniref:protein MAIN-LIKE 2-like n=1 Tax=Setaria viridis TaxID=4556 RepID=UPI003B3A0954